MQSTSISITSLDLLSSARLPFRSVAQIGYSSEGSTIEATITYPNTLFPYIDLSNTQRNGTLDT